MVQLLVERPERRLDLGKILDPAAVAMHVALEPQLDAETVAVQARAFVPLGHPGQAVRRLDGEFLEDLHPAIVPGRRGFMGHLCALAVGHAPSTRS